MPLPPLRPPVVTIPGRRRIPAPRPSTKVANRRVVARLRKQYERIQGDSFDMGLALNTLQETDVVAQYGETKFRDFVEKNIMPYTTAHRCMVVSRHFTKTTATKLGVRKAALLHRYVETLALRSSAEKLGKADRKIGSPGRKISELSTRDIEKMITNHNLLLAKAKIPKPTAKVRRDVAKMKKRFIEEFGVVPKVNINMKTGMMELEITLDEARRLGIDPDAL